MSRRWVLVSSITAGLAIAGCAVLTVDVDVYKGALSNHESVQTEQVAAMAMGAKPLLAELRVQLERRACFDRLEELERRKGLFTAIEVDESHPDFQKECQAYARMRHTARFVADVDALSRQTARVNAILSLYDDAPRGQAGELVRFLQERLKDLEDSIRRGRPFVETYLGSDHAAHPERARILARESQILGRDPRRCTKMPEQCPHGLTDVQVAAVQTAWGAAREAWREAMRLLSSEAIRSQMENNPEALDAVAWIAASLTSLDGLNEAIGRTKPPPLPAAVTTGPFEEMRRRIPILESRGPLQAPLGIREEKQDREKRVKEAYRARYASRGALSELLQDETIGRRLATQLLMAQAHAESPEVLEGWVALYPSEAILLNQDDLVFDASNFGYLMQVFQRIRDTGLGRGRVEEGLENLIEDYLNTAKRKSPSPRELARSRERLLDALINFGEKISIIANLDILVQDSAAGDTRKYTRLLQAVGNSIISQVDALRQMRAHQDRLEDARDIEVAGLRNAEMRASPALQRLADTLEGVDTFTGQAVLVAALRSNQSSLKTLVRDLSGRLLTERAALDVARNTSANWDAAMNVVTRAEVHAAVTTYAATAGNVPTATVVQHLAGVLGGWEGQAVLPGGAGASEARRLARAASLLTGEYTGQPYQADAGPALDKLTGLAREVRRGLDRATSGLARAARIVGALERAHGTTAQLAGGAPLAGLPSRLDPGRGDATAKDVLDVMLATLRYEHVEAVRQGRDSEIAKDRLAAVELLYAYRSGMIHIRPAATFLRNSYPATVLQNDPTAGVWRNMLTDHAKRQLPFYDFFLSQQEEAKINNTIDKQFWQRVNQVRVAGVGRTNYAIAKDDVGNWYVKDYGSNPTDIIRSAQSLAMFAAGPAMGANLLARPGARQTLGAAAGGGTSPPALPPRPGDTGEGGGATGAVATAQPVAAEAPRSTLQRQLDRHAKKYDDTTRKARVDLKAAIEKLWGNGTLQAAVRDAVTPDETAIIARQDASVFAGPQDTAVFNALADDNEGREPKTAAASNRNIAEALRAVKQHRLQVLARIDRLPVAGADETFDRTQHVRPEARGLAKTAVNTVIRDFLEKVLREREAATGAYEQAILFIGETAGL